MTKFPIQVTEPSQWAREFAKKYLSDIMGSQNPEDHAAVWFEAARRQGAKDIAKALVNISLHPPYTAEGAIQSAIRLANTFAAKGPNDTAAPRSPNDRCP